MEDLEIEETSLKVDLKIHGVIEDTFSKKVMFLLTIIDKSIEYIKYRSHIDFALLRSNLSKKWISLTVPGLCKISSSILKTHADEYLEAKKKYFLSFLLECISIPAILNSSDFQLFIKGPDNFSENAKAAAPDYRNIYTKYQAIYKPYSGIQYTLASIQDCYEKYKTTSIEIKNQKKLIKKLFEKFERMKENHKISYSKQAFLSQNYISTLNDSALESQLADYNIQINPYSSLLEWITKENLILKSIIESIEKFFEIEKLVTNFYNKINKKKEKLKHLESGKQSFSSMFDTRPTPEILIQENFSINEMENTVHCLNQLRTIVLSELMSKTIPHLEKSKKQRYESHLLTFCEDSLHAFSLKIS